MIIQSGLHLVPIYQDNTGDVSDYTFKSGLHDGSAAVRAALALGIPDHHTIYFAVDTDMTEYENNHHAIPYFRGVAKAIKYYQIGVYGTRNTCTMVSNAVSSVKFSYVSNMSTGYSGNLGFSQPLNWSFDQFDEVGPQGNLPGRDKVAVSHEDEGVTNLVESRAIDGWVKRSNWKLMKRLMANHNIELNGKSYVLINNESLKVTVSYKNVSSLNIDTPLTFTYPIKNGKIDSAISADFSSHGFLFGANIAGMMNQFTAGLESGYVTLNTELNKKTLYINHLTVTISDEKIKPQNNTFTNQDVIVFDIDVNWTYTQKELAEQLKNPANLAVQKTAQSMLAFMQGGGLSLNNQIGFGLTSTIVATLSNLNELPEETTKAVGTASIVVIVLGIMLGTFDFV